MIFTSSKLNVQASLPQTEMWLIARGIKLPKKIEQQGCRKASKKSIFLNFAVPSHDKAACHRVFICQPFKGDTMESAPERRYFGNNKKLLAVFIRMMIMKTKVAVSEWSSSMNSSFCHTQTHSFEGLRGSGKRGIMRGKKAIWQP